MSDASDYKDKETLQRLYVEDEERLIDIADQFDVTTGTIWYWLQKHEIVENSTEQKEPPSDVSIETGLEYREEETLSKLYTREGWTCSEIADLFDVALSTIQRWLSRNEIEMRPRGPGTPDYAILRTKRAMSGGGHEVWKATYKEEVEDVPVHRLLAVALFGFDALKDKHVHHINHIPWDNRPENLQLLSPSSHTRLHNLYRSEPGPNYPQKVES